MTDNSDRAIGRLEGTLSELTRAFERSEKSASDARARVYAKLESMGSDLDQVKRSNEAVSKRIAAVEPMAQEFSRWRERGIGAVMMFGLLSASIGSAILAGGQYLWHVLTAR